MKFTEAQRGKNVFHVYFLKFNVNFLLPVCFYLFALLLQNNQLFSL